MIFSFHWISKLQKFVCFWFISAKRCILQLYLFAEKSKEWIVETIFTSNNILHSYLRIETQANTSVRFGGNITIFVWIPSYTRIIKIKLRKISKTFLLTSLPVSGQADGGDLSHSHIQEMEPEQVLSPLCVHQQVWELNIGHADGISFSFYNNN